MKFINKIKNVFFGGGTHTVSPKEYYSPEEIVADASNFYDKEDLVYFSHLQMYGAFKYAVVKDIFANSKAITVSDVHLALNDIYFSTIESIHQNNKKAAYQHLTFLSKGLQYEPNGFMDQLYLYYKSQFPINQPFSLTEHLINPLVFVNLMKEYGFLDTMPSLNPFAKEYHHVTALETINACYKDTSLLFNMMYHFLSENNQIPPQMQHFLDDIETTNEMRIENISKFFASMIFSGTHSTASFLTSYTHALLSDHKDLLQKADNTAELEALENEILRIYMPVQWVFRTVRANTTYNGITLKENDTVLLFVGAANMDPNVFPNPTAIDLNRKMNHLSFGVGPYACIGRFSNKRSALSLARNITNDFKLLELQNQNRSYKIVDAIVHIPLDVVFRGNA